MVRSSGMFADAGRARRAVGHDRLAQARDGVLGTLGLVSASANGSKIGIGITFASDSPSSACPAMVSRAAVPEDDSRVAALTTLAGWRQFAGEMPAAPELLDSRTWKDLDKDKRAAYDDDRIAHHSRLLVVQTPAVRDVVTTGRRLAHMNRSAHYG